MEPGEHSSPVSFNSSSDDIVTLLRPAFDRALEIKRKRLDDQTDLDPSRMVLPLVIESDAPCRVIVGPAHLIGQLEADLLTGPVGLTFTSGADNTQRVVVDPPVGTRLGIDVDATVAQREAVPLNEPPPLPPTARAGAQRRSRSRRAVSKSLCRARAGFTAAGLTSRFSPEPTG
jgi:hypothetical protein